MSQRQTPRRSHAPRGLGSQQAQWKLYFNIWSEGPRLGLGEKQTEGEERVVGIRDLAKEQGEGLGQLVQ